jgi:hypothetical protein
MATVVNGSVYPPDNSGNWHDDGWGGWTNDSSLYNVVPEGFTNCWGKVIIPNKPNPTLDNDTKKAVLKTLDESKTFDNTKVGRLMSQVLVYGNSFLSLLVRARIIDNPTLPISLSNINQEELQKMLNNGGLSQSTTVNKAPPPNNAPTNSNFLGIDFSNGANVILLVFGFVGLFKLLTSGTPSTSSN